MRVKRHSQLFGVLLVILGLIPAVLALLVLLTLKVTASQGNFPMILVLLCVFAVLGIGAALARVLSGAVSRLSGRALSEADLKEIGNAVVEAVMALDR